MSRLGRLSTTAVAAAAATGMSLKQLSESRQLKDPRNLSVGTRVVSRGPDHIHGVITTIHPPMEGVLPPGVDDAPGDMDAPMQYEVRTDKGKTERFGWMNILPETEAEKLQGGRKRRHTRRHRRKSRKSRRT
jgi:hypothetical protein